MCTVQKKVCIFNITAWFCKLPAIMEINDTVCCAEIKALCLDCAGVRRQKAWSSQVSSTMPRLVFAIQIESDINEHREGKDTPLLLHLILCSAGKRPAFCRNRCSIWWRGCSLRGATVSCFMFQGALSVTKMTFYCVFEFTEGIVRKGGQERTWNGLVFSCLEHCNVFLPAVIKKR